MARPIPEINAGSMADIAFLLLIFFLVTTTMSTNSGVQSKLPPLPEDEQKTVVDVKERNVLVVLVNKDNNIAIKGHPIELKDIYEKTREFILNPNNSDNLPEKELKKDIPYFGDRMVSKGIISLQADRNTEYNKYLQVQNELRRAINDLRNEISKQKFGKLFDDLSESQQDAVSLIYPLNISEAEPRKMITQ
jgi:biopolymer transport protein ExbD